MRGVLQGLYRASGIAAALLVAAIAVLTLAQVAARLMGQIVPSADDFATFSMAGAIFLGLTATYRAGVHIRVEGVLQRVALPARRALELFSLVVAAASTGYLAWYTLDMVITTYTFKEYTLGLMPIPKWLPMSSMLGGMLVFLVALLDDLVVLLAGGTPSYAQARAAAGPIGAAAE